MDLKYIARQKNVLLHPQLATVAVLVEEHVPSVRRAADAEGKKRGKVSSGQLPPCAMATFTVNSPAVEKSTWEKVDNL